MPRPRRRRPVTSARINVADFNGTHEIFMEESGPGISSSSATFLSLYFFSSFLFPRLSTHPFYRFSPFLSPPTAPSPCIASHPLPLPPIVSRTYKPSHHPPFFLSLLTRPIVNLAFRRLPHASSHVISYKSHSLPSLPSPTSHRLPPVPSSPISHPSCHPPSSRSGGGAVQWVYCLATSWCPHVARGSSQVYRLPGSGPS